MANLLCLGDSITDCGRFFSDSPLGDGYVRILSEKLKSAGMDYKITNCGVDGFTVARLLENARNYLSIGGDIITILIGINDIGLMMNTGRSQEQQKMMMSTFSRHYEDLLTKLMNPGRQIILMEPFIFPWPAEYRNWILHVKTMSQEIEKLAGRYHLPYIFLHDCLNAEARRYGLDAITLDGIHLTTQGHEILAQKLMEVISQNG